MSHPYVTSKSKGWQPSLAWVCAAIKGSRWRLQVRQLIRFLSTPTTQPWSEATGHHSMGTGSQAELGKKPRSLDNLMKEPTHDGSQARDIKKMTGSPPSFSKSVDVFKEERLISVHISGQSVVAVSQAFCGHRCYFTQGIGKNL